MYVIAKDKYLTFNNILNSLRTKEKYLILIPISIIYSLLPNCHQIFSTYRKYPLTNLNKFLEKSFIPKISIPL